MTTQAKTKAFTKTVHVGDIKPHDSAPYVPIFCKIEYSADGRLSISGVIGPKRNGDAWGGCGQIDMEFEHRNPVRFAEGWDKDKWFDFLEAWKLYHLNDMQSACEHQRALGWTYESHREHVEPIETPAKGIPGNVITFTKKGACPTCGYRIGTAWLKMEVPESVLGFLRALPDTDVKPAWI